MLFGIPAVELTNGDFNGQEVLGQRINELHCRLGEATTFRDRVRAADNVLTAARPATESVSAIVLTARAIIRNEGSVRVSDIFHQTGLGLRQFERRFAHEIGVSPKLYARIIRFEAALQWRVVSPSMSWTEIAHELGYHDQMHMVHDFTRLSGDSPEAISSQLDMFVQPEVLTGRPTTKLARMP